MARDLTGASAFMDCVAAVTAMPCTIAMWIKPSNASSGTMAGISDGSNNNRVYIQRSASTDPSDARAVEVAAGSSAGISSAGSLISNNVWHHWAGTYLNASSRSVFVDGANKATNTSGLGAMATLNHIYIGASGAGVVSGARFYVAEVGIWDVVLSDADIALLGASKYAPGLVNAAHLKGWWKLLGTTSPEPNEVSGGVALTLTGSPPSATHPPGIVYTLAPTADSVFWSKNQVESYVTTSLTTFMHQDAATTDGDWEEDTALTIPLSMQTSFRWDSSGTAPFPGPYITVNWVGDIFDTPNQAPVGTITSDAGSDLYIGNRAALDSGWSGYISEFMLWHQTLLTSPQLNLLFIEEQAYFGTP